MEQCGTSGRGAWKVLGPLRSRGTPSTSCRCGPASKPRGVGTCSILRFSTYYKESRAGHKPGYQRTGSHNATRREISRRIPSESLCQPDASSIWWDTERHHGLGNNAHYHGQGHTMMPLTGPGFRNPRRALSPSSGKDADKGSDESHRRRRLLAN